MKNLILISSSILLLLLTACGGQNPSPSVEPSTQEPEDTFQPYCSGTETSCDQLYVDSTRCIYQDGCSFQLGSCAGVNTELCSSNTAQYSCEDILGCYWSTGFSECSGTPVTCGMLYDESDCFTASGCNWDRDSCNGVATTCENEPGQAFCEGQEGCFWNATN